MGVTVKTLLIHLREHQEQYGVRAFRFHHVLRNNVVESANYPTNAQSVLDSEDPDDQVELKPKTATKKEEVTEASTSQIHPIPIQETTHKHVSSTNERAPEQPSIPVPLLGWSQMPHPNSWHPHLMPFSNPNMPHYSLPFPYGYDSHPVWWPSPVPPAEQPLRHPEQLVHGFHAPPKPPEPGMLITPPFHPPSQFMDPQTMPQWGGHSVWGPTPGPPAEQSLRGFHAPPKPPEPRMPSAPPFQPPSHSMDPHPIPTGDPPFAFMYPIPLDPKPIDQSVRTPTKKKPPPDTPKKTPGKRKRKEAGEDTPFKEPTRASNRTRTPKKRFEIDQ